MSAWETKCGKGAEILLDNKAQCNLTTVNVVPFVIKNGDTVSIDSQGLKKAEELSARARISQGTASTIGGCLTILLGSRQSQATIFLNSCS